MPSAKWKFIIGGWVKDKKSLELHLERENVQVWWKKTFAWISGQSNVTYQLLVGGFECYKNHNEQCVPPNTYISWYIWTKEGFKIQIKVFRFKIIIFNISIFWTFHPVSTTRIPDSKSIWIIWWFMLGHGVLHMVHNLVHIQTARVHSWENGTYLRRG